MSTEESLDQAQPQEEVAGENAPVSIKMHLCHHDFISFLSRPDSVNS